MAPAWPAPSRPALLLPWSPRDKDTKAQVRLAGHRPRAASQRRGREASLPPQGLSRKPQQEAGLTPIGNTPALRPSSSPSLRAGTGRPLITGSPGSEQHREAGSQMGGGLAPVTLGDTGSACARMGHEAAGGAVRSVDHIEGTRRGHGDRTRFRGMSQPGGGCTHGRSRSRRHLLRGHRPPGGSQVSVGQPGGQVRQSSPDAPQQATAPGLLPSTSCPDTGSPREEPLTENGAERVML